MSPEDCRKVRCPSLLKIAADKGVAAAGFGMLEASQKDHLERMAFLYNGPNGTIRVGQVYVGQVGGMNPAPEAPNDAIGSIHTHPDETKGDPATGQGPVPGSPPSGDDAAYAEQNHINGVVEATPARYFTPWNRPSGYHAVPRSAEEQQRLREDLKERPQ